MWHSEPQDPNWDNVKKLSGNAGSGSVNIEYRSATLPKDFVQRDGSVYKRCHVIILL
jgi:hypothetical protein